MDPRDQVLDGTPSDPSPEVQRDRVDPFPMDAADHNVQPHSVRPGEAGRKPPGLAHRRPRRVGERSDEVGDRFREPGVGGLGQR